MLPASFKVRRQSRRRISDHKLSRDALARCYGISSRTRWVEQVEDLGLKARGVFMPVSVDLPPHIESRSTVLVAPADHSFMCGSQAGVWAGVYRPGHLALGRLGIHDVINRR